jgi:hypothetical protein
MASGLPKNTVMCQDDDPSCDIYDEPGNKLCVFRLAICLNVTDPRLACTPIDVAGVDVKKPKAYNPTDPYADFNRGSIAFNVPLKETDPGVFTTGRARIKLKAFSSNDLLTGRPSLIDRDAIKLICLPSPSGAFLEETGSLFD